MRRLSYMEVPELKNTERPSYTGEIKNFVEYYDKEKVSEYDPKKMEYGIEKLRLYYNIKADERKFVLKAMTSAVVAIAPMAVAGSFMPDSPVHYIAGLTLIPGAYYTLKNSIRADRTAQFAAGVIKNNKDTFSAMNDKVHALNYLNPFVPKKHRNKKRK